MRREHASIIVDVLDALARYGEENRGAFHVTALASRANLPHDRLRTCLDELAMKGLISLGPVPAPTVKGRQFLECYHAWVRVQQIYGLQTRPDAPPLRTVPAMVGVATDGRTAAMAADPASGSASADPSAAPAPGMAAAHGPFGAPEAVERGVRGH